MRSTTSIFSLTALALGAAAFQPAIAQNATSELVRPVVAVAADAPVIRTIAIYRFTASRILRLPVTITVADSSGQLIATYRLPNSPRPAPMQVDVLGNDIILQGETDRGLLTLVLSRQNDGNSPSSFIGWWSLGNDEHGDLRGRTQR
ncbi:MAG: hypothetical protein ABI664_07805 [bacterium]